MKRRSVFLVAAAAALAVVATMAAWVAWPLPPDVASPGPVPSLVIQDRHGIVLRTTRADDGSRGGWIPYADIDPDIIVAFLAAEDQRFFDHHGVDVRAVLRAALANLRAGEVVSGASTLTMQAARLLRPLPRTWLGKAAQALWALRLEAHLGKDRILEEYLNRVPLGQASLGVSAAARLYFGASATDLSLGQATLLAALAHAPSRDNPLVSAERARRRRDRVLDRLAERGMATPGDIARARGEPVLGASAEPRFLAPHFTTQLLLAGAGPEGDAPGSGVWRTSLDLELQRRLEAEVRHTVATLHDRGARQAALVVLDNRNGQILAWVGSPDFWADTAGQVDMVVSPRQPGSALKPFLYGLAFDHGYSPATVLPDVPHTYQTTSGPYRPQNYDRRFRGPVRIREALASSLNVPAVEMTDRVGTGALLATLHAAGFGSLHGTADFYGLGLALGNGEVTLLELANAYRGIAMGGVWRPVTWRIDDAQAPLPGPGGAGGNAASRREPGSTVQILPGPGGAGGNAAAGEAVDPLGGHRFMSAGAAALVLDILEDPVARIPGFGLSTPFDFPFPAAAKTGTSRHFTDNWAVAATGNFTVAVWVGNFSGQPMKGVSGVSGAGPLLHRAVLETARRYPPGYLVTPEQVGAAPLSICILSGLRATPDCPSMVEWFLPGTEPTRVDDWQVAGRTALPAEYAEWARDHRPDSRTLAAGGASAGSDLAGGEPPATGTGADDDAARPYTILSPRDGDRYQVPPGVAPRYATIALSALGGAPDERASWFVDGKRWRGTRWRLTPGAHTFRVVWPSGHTAQVAVVVDQ